MRRIVSLWDSSVGKKITMAVTGLILLGFVVAHMAGNLKVHAMLALGYGCGLRDGEIVRLKAGGIAMARR